MANPELLDEFKGAIATLTAILDADYVDLSNPDAYENLHYRSAPPRCIVSTGLFAVGLLAPGEDVHIVCVGTNTRNTFWSLVHETLQLSDKFNMKDAIRDDVLELSSKEVSINGGERGACLRTFARMSWKDQLYVKTYLYYCHLSLEKNISDLITGRLNISLANEIVPTGLRMAIEAQQSLNSAGMKTNTQRDLFKKIFTMTYDWAASCGLMGSRFGFLNANLLMRLIIDVLSPSLPDNLDETRECLEVFTRFKQRLSDICLLRQDDRLNAPGAHLVRSTQHRFMKETTSEARTAIAHAVTFPAPDDGQQAPSNPNAGFHQFLLDYPHLFIVDCESWARNIDQRVTFQEKDVPRNINAAVEELRNQHQNMQIAQINIRGLRIWPNPLVHRADHSEQVLVIGINGDHQSREQLEKNIHDLQEYIEQHILDYDRTIGIISFKQTTAEQLENYSSRVSTPDRAPEMNPPTPSTDKKKFRPAHSAISRLLHDPKHRDGDFLVGYVDRFTDALAWVTLQQWVGKQTEDMVFIRVHRVRRIVRVAGRQSGEEMVLWDREERVDAT